ncbi:hypothetical protein HOP50_06g43470 [Chloropicon primus]|uniref:Uncharacterized protein n=1 Tax=Chloropicon primus TaxID=1764295 RepID=A0A5B8MMM4_9CHLO|nr:hypothetical protein A3770_06p43240 [Chloropicon primus]UPR01026.1 hypothetical protein HOP50_06g43470 [Chloropicon primus]|eukprot:QDZ21806.1 hypothetical protein A3770_06p43240 [Chloropicon primus]
MSGEGERPRTRPEEGEENRDYVGEWREAVASTSAAGGEDESKEKGAGRGGRRKSLYERIEPRRKKKEARADEIRREREELELKEVTFSPKISTYSKKLMSRRGSVEERLLNSELEKNSAIEELRRLHSLEELEECTFKPAVRTHDGGGASRDPESTVELPVFGRLLAAKSDSRGRRHRAMGRPEEGEDEGGLAGDDGDDGDDDTQVFERLWAVTRLKQQKDKKQKPSLRRRESILPNGAPLPAFALDLRTPHKSRRKKANRDKAEKKGHREWIDHLYKDASVRRKVQKKREAVIDQEILDRTSCYSMNNQSFNIMMKTVSRQTMLGLEKHAPNSDSLLHEDFVGVVIEFEILPPLDKLGVRYLKYLPEEEQLVERLWNILAAEVTEAGSGGQLEVVPKASFHDFMILVECCILNGAVKQEMREMFNEKKDRDNVEFWKVLEAVAEMKLVNKQAYSNLRAEPSPVSQGREIVAKRDRKSFQRFYKGQLSHHKRVKDKTDLLREKLDEKELSNCTFAPKLLPKRPKGFRKHLKAASKPKGSSRAMVVHQKEVKKSPKALCKPHRSTADQQNCVKFAVVKYPKGYTKHLDRMEVPTEFDPHCCHYVSERKRECVLSRIAFYFEVWYQGKFVSIPVHVRDNPRKIALVIAKHLGIPKEAYTELLSIVKNKMIENGCTQSFEDSDDKIAFTYSYADQYAQSRGLEKPWKHLYSVFDKESMDSYAVSSLGNSELDYSSEEEKEYHEEEEEYYEEEVKPEELPYRTTPAVLSGEEGGRGYSKPRGNEKSVTTQKVDLRYLARSYYDPKGAGQENDSSFAKMILDPGFVGVNSLMENDSRSLRAYRKDLRAALLTEPPEHTSREHLLKAMNDLWLPVK